MRAEAVVLGLDSPGTAPWRGLWEGLSEPLRELGFELGFVTLVGARETEVEESVRQALARSNILIITGGGPDELTKKILSRLLGKRLILQADMLDRLRAAYRARGMDAPAASEKAALLPYGSRALMNGQGVPQGFYMEHEGRHILYIPRLPDDFRKALPEDVLKALTVRGRPRRYERSLVIRTYGLDEAKVRELIKGSADAALSFIASPDGVDVKATVRAGTVEKAERLLEETASEIKKKLGDYCYGTGGETMEEVVGRLLTGRRLTIATAESCTGGLVAKRLTDVPGSSAYMERGVVTYSNRSKEELLNVPAATISEHGAVSKETASAMAEGVRWNAGVDLGLSITGVAGPTGGTIAKPVGLVYIGLATPEGVAVRGFNFPGERQEIRCAASQKALDIVRRYLLS